MTVRLWLNGVPVELETGPDNVVKLTRELFDSMADEHGHVSIQESEPVREAGDHETLAVRRARANIDGRPEAEAKQLDDVLGRMVAELALARKERRLGIRDVETFAETLDGGERGDLLVRASFLLRRPEDVRVAPCLSLEDYEKRFPDSSHQRLIGMRDLLVRFGGGACAYVSGDGAVLGVIPIKEVAFGRIDDTRYVVVPWGDL